jgi:hypothetical protein
VGIGEYEKEGDGGGGMTNGGLYLARDKYKIDGRMNGKMYICRMTTESIEKRMSVVEYASMMIPPVSRQAIVWRLARYGLGDMLPGVISFEQIGRPFILTVDLSKLPKESDPEETGEEPKFEKPKRKRRTKSEMHKNELPNKVIYASEKPAYDAEKIEPTIMDEFSGHTTEPTRSKAMEEIRKKKLGL